jgi:MATE family multidrug resistance protein
LVQYFHVLFAEKMDNGVKERLLGLEEQEETDIKQRIWVELKLMWRIAFPSILARVTAFGMIVVTQSFIGRVSELDLAAYALVQSILLRFSNGILVSS